MDQTFQSILDAAARQDGMRMSERSVPLTTRKNCSVLPAIHRRIRECNESMLRTLRAAITGKAPWPLFVHGTAGTGKTCGALSLLDWIAGGRQGLYVDLRYTTVADLCALLVRCDKGHEMLGCGCCDLTHRHVWAAVKSETLTVLDELGSRTVVSDHHYETVRRYQDSREGLPTIYLSNLAPDRLALLYDDRVVSRLCSGTIVELSGSDRRIG